MLSWSHLRGAVKGVRIAARSSNPEGLARGSYPISAPARWSLCYSAGVWQSPWTVSCEWSVSRAGEQWSALAAVPASNEKGLWQVSFWELVDACYFVYVPLSFSLFPKQGCSAKPFMICEQGSRALWTLKLIYFSQVGSWNTKFCLLMKLDCPCCCHSVWQEGYIYSFLNFLSFPYRIIEAGVRKAAYCLCLSSWQTWWASSESLHEEPLGGGYHKTGVSVYTQEKI